MNQITVNSTSRSSAVVGDILLRETKTTRLLFRPLLVDNLHDQEASVKGNFIFQRKIQAGSWEDHKELNLSQLRANEWVQIELKSAELLKFFRSLSDLYEIYRRGGIPLGEVKIVPIEFGLSSLLASSEEELSSLLNEEPSSGSELLSRLLTWCSQIGLTEQIVQSLEHINSENLQELTVLAGLTNLRAALKVWEDNQENSNEEFWQITLSEYSFVLSQIFAHPVVIVKGKAFIGGKSVENSGGNLVDFLAQNEVSKNAVLIEIKTPQTSLLGSQYRTNTYNISSELSGAVIQVANYKHSLESEFASLQRNSSSEMESFEPVCVVIAGTYRAQVDNQSKKRSFELFRSHLRGIQIITYDELFQKVRILIDLLEGGNDQTVEFEEDDIPF